MIRVTTREFRDKQKKLLELADTGEEVYIIKKNKSYLIMPIEEEDTKFSKEFLKKIDERIEDYRKNGGYVMKEDESLDEFIERIKTAIKQGIDLREK